MAWRNRTTDFTRLRDDHTLRRGSNRYKDYSSRKTLLDAQDVEMKEHIVYLPPDWIARVTDIQYEITTIRSRCMLSFYPFLFPSPWSFTSSFYIELPIITSRLVFPNIRL